MNAPRQARRSLLAAGICVVLPGPQVAPAAAQGLGVAREAAVKAAFIYKFCAFVEWPAGAFANATAPAVIGVYGDDAVVSELEQLTRGREIQGRPVSVLRIRDADALPTLHALYAGGPKVSRVREMLASVRGPVLTVADTGSGGDGAAVLLFTQDEGRVRFTASLSAAATRGLRLSAKLLAVAQNVEGR